MDKALNNAEMGLLLPNTRVLRYRDLFRFKNIEKALSPGGSMALLYPADSENDGHWVGIFYTINNKGKKVIEFFDPYGISPDLEFREAPQFEQTQRHLAYLLSRAHLPIVYNEHKIQSRNPDISTCGRHVVNRIWWKAAPLEHYIAIFGGKDSDRLVTEITSFI